MQLDLLFYPSDSVRGVLSSYVAMRSETCSEETIRHDYACRVEWLLQVLGEMTPARTVTFEAIEKAARAGRAVLLKDTTIKRRIQFWISACRWAAQRGIEICEVQPPPWLKNDAVRCEDMYTPVQFAAFRLALPPGRFRIFADLAYWTGQHTFDVLATESAHLEPDYEWEDGGRGRWWRRNHKNRKCRPQWFKMEPELRAAVLELEPGALPLGGLNNIRRAFIAAAVRAELPVVRPNLGLRASHATVLMTRGYPYEYVRQVLGHEGEIWSAPTRDGFRAATTRPSTLSRHYLRPWTSTK